MLMTDIVGHLWAHEIQMHFSGSPEKKSAVHKL